MANFLYVYNMQKVLKEFYSCKSLKYTTITMQYDQVECVIWVMQGGFSIKKHFRVYFRCHIDMTFKTSAWLSQILTPHLFQSLKFNQCIFQGLLYVSSYYLWLSFPESVEFFPTLSVLQMLIYSFLDNKRHSFWILSPVSLSQSNLCVRYLLL